MSKVLQYLEKYDVKIYSRDSEFVRTKAVWRNGTNPSSVCINVKTGTAIDFGDSCEIYTLIEFLEKYTGYSIEDKDAEKIDEFAVSEVFEKSETYPKDEQVFKDEILDSLVPDHSFWLKRGISKETLNFYKGGLSHEGKMYLRYVWPVYNKYNKIHGLIGRDITNWSNREGKKYKNLGDSRRFLFGVFNKDDDGIQTTIRSILDIKEVILVEGPSDKVAAHEDGVYNVIPTIGLKVSKLLQDFLLNFDLQKIKVAFNKDGEENNFVGENASVKAAALLMRRFGGEKVFIKPPYQNDLLDDLGNTKKWDNDHSLENKDFLKQCFEDKINRFGEKKLTKEEKYWAYKL